MTNVTRRSFVGAIAAPFLSRAATRRPNIVFILADDLGYGDAGCYGQKRIQTPNIDRLAREGVRFRQAYAGSTVCAPSRCCLMTGFHTGHARVRGNKSPELHLRQQDVTVAETLRDAGYRTGIFGKWALGGIGTAGYPLAKGFHEWFGFFSQGQAHNYYPELLLDGQSEQMLQGNRGADKKDYAHDLFTERALQFVERNKDRPFFLYLPYTIPHANNELGRDTGNGMEVPSDAPYSQEGWPRQEKNFAAMVTRMDRDIGALMDRLKTTGQEEDTLVLFTSDNGPHQEGGHKADFFDSNGPLRGIKRDLYEGGIRVPAIARWPGKIDAGRVSDHVWAFWDFLPTAADIAGAPMPGDLDGISILPELLGKEQPKHEYLYWEFHERGFHQAVRMGDWKGVRFGTGKPVELYNLAEDIGETNNVASRHSDVVRRIEALMDSARTESDEFPRKVG